MCLSWRRREGRAIATRTEDEALREWRRKATDLVAAASVVVHLPLVLSALAGYGPPAVWPVAEVLSVATYLVIVAAATARRVDQRLRAKVMIAAIYGLALVGSVAVPQGPYIRAVPLVPPMVALGLLGLREARLCTVLSAGVLLSAPYVQSIPLVARLLAVDPAAVLDPAGRAWLPGAALTAELVVLMVLLERFYAFLIESLDAQRRAAAEREAAGQKLQREVEERRRLENEIARAGDEERRRLGHEIHDGVCQQLTGALLRCQALELRLARGTPLRQPDLVALAALLGEAIHEARSVAQGLCPLQAAPDALAPALHALAKRTRQTAGIACEFRGSGDLAVPDPAAAQHLYRIAQEAVGNAVRHARASAITVELAGGGDSLSLRVEDDGVGPPDGRTGDGMGLRTMSFRAQLLDGELAVEPAPGGGTRVSCRVPRPAPPPAARPAPAGAVR